MVVAILSDKLLHLWYSNSVDDYLVYCSLHLPQIFAGCGANGSVRSDVLFVCFACGSVSSELNKQDSYIPRVSALRFVSVTELE